MELGLTSLTCLSTKHHIFQLLRNKMLLQDKKKMYLQAGLAVDKGQENFLNIIKIKARIASNFAKNVTVVTQ